MSNKDAVAMKKLFVPEAAHPQDNTAHLDSANAAPIHAEPPQHEDRVSPPAQSINVSISYNQHVQHNVHISKMPVTETNQHTTRY